MTHFSLEQYVTGPSSIHELPVAVKLIALLSFLLLLLIITPVFSLGIRYGLYSCWGLFLLGITHKSNVPLRLLVSRSALVLPFSGLIIMVNLLAGQFTLAQTIETLIRSLFSVFALLLLNTTTPFHAILKQFSQWKFPQLIILVLAFMYRYFFLLVSESQALRQVVFMRHPALSGWPRVRIYANIIGLLIIRSYERAERVYQAMRMRGFTGELS